MYSLNRAMILGNLTRDPEKKQLPSGQAVCTFGVATNRSWTDQSGQRQEQTEFHNMVAWGKLADICSQYLTKGRKVYVDGRLQTRDWEGQDGVRRYRTEIVVDNIILLDRQSNTSTGMNNNTFSSNPSASNQDDPSVDPSQEIKLEDIPF
ncbi:single-stranded DNA-binding protein [Candidatus Uhrbacteria bacterium CG_4_9_14_3_um_filter_36_7]|uniref:Single-stranded DNA-binding protein n=1 Tax=Candidatus Uhrbacteria bacterium CG_4_9_14_3_um_filter_36_7 TaxID=1975033 RepID=A0A2M7XHY3_9BACT|nr:MAG: single-stranded DNA-binding protein [Candidatus Uhrbacteria bacterium CG_4_9_14_3_um_filter_36_7]